MCALGLGQTRLLKTPSIGLLKLDVDVRQCFHGNAVEEGWCVPPLPDGIERRICKISINAAQYTNRLHSSIRSNDRLKSYCTFNSSVLCIGWIDWFDLIY